MSFLSNRNICKIAIVIISRLRDWNVYLWLFPGSTTVFISLICRQRARPDFSFQRSFFDTFFTSCASSTSSLKDKDKDKEHSFSTVNHFWLRSLFKGIGYDGGGRGGRGWAELLLHHQLLYSSYYSNTFGLMGNLAPFGPCIMIARLFSEIVKRRSLTL